MLEAGMLGPHCLHASLLCLCRGCCLRLPQLLASAQGCRPPRGRIPRPLLFPIWQALPLEQPARRQACHQACPYSPLAAQTPAQTARPPLTHTTPGPPGSYHCNLNILLGKMRAGGGAIKWADVNALKAELEAQVGGLGGTLLSSTLLSGTLLSGMAPHRWACC